MRENGIPTRPASRMSINTYTEQWHPCPTPSPDRETVFGNFSADLVQSHLPVTSQQEAHPAGYAATDSTSSSAAIAGTPMAYGQSGHASTSTQMSDFYTRADTLAYEFKSPYIPTPPNSDHPKWFEPFPPRMEKVTASSYPRKCKCPFTVLVHTNVHCSYIAKIPNRFVYIRGG